MTIESRNMAECLKNKGLSDFKTEITIAGVSQRFVVPCGVDTCLSSGYVLKGSLEVKLTDFGIDPPKKFFGLVKVNNEVLIDYVFSFQTDNDNDLLSNDCNVTIVTQGRLIADKTDVEKISQHKNMHILEEHDVTEILVEDKVEGVSIRLEQDHDKYPETIPCQGVFIQVGFLPNTEFCRDLVW